MVPEPRMNCAVDAAMSVIEGRWKCTIICILAHDGEMRFSEILRKIDGVSSRILSKQLKELEADGIVDRNVHDDSKITYSLTKRGESLLPVLGGLAQWGLDNIFSNRVVIEES